MYWRSSTVCPHGHGIVDPRFHPRRWMLLPKGHGLHPDGDKKRFFNRSTGATACPRLPLLGGHGVLDSVDGLLLLYQQQKDQDKICLLNPFTGDIAELPPFTSVVATSGEEFGLRVRSFHVMSGHLTPSLSVSEDGVVTVMIAPLWMPHVIFATTKDKEWSMSAWTFLRYERCTLSSQGKLYMLKYL
ncbi:hypothetical protein ACQ4PT_016360 [Festuca glaucescens]